MIIDYEKVNVINKERCPYFVGVKENGNMATFQLDYDNWEKVEEFINDTTNANIVLGTSNRINVYENEKITISEIWRNERREEWEEENVYEFSGELKKGVERAITYMLYNAPIHRNSDNLHITNFKDLIEFVKSSNF